MLEVQQFLETRSFGELAKEWGVYARCDKSGRKFSLNYDQLEYTPGHLPTEQCRGLILGLDEKDKIPTVNGKVDESFCPGKTKVMAYPFDKFYNDHEIHAAKIDWASASVWEKLDGTLCILYWDYQKKEWCVATRSVPEADAPIDGWQELTFRKLFEQGVQETFQTSFQDWTNGLRQDVTFMFELTSPHNRIFVSYPKTNVTLLGARDLNDFRELSLDEVTKTSNRVFSFPKIWSLKSAIEVQSFVNEQSPADCEGAIVVDNKFNRVKIKNVNWVTANATKTTVSASPRNLLRYVLSGISDDITTLLPDEVKKNLTKMQEGVTKLFRETDENFKTWKREAIDRKHFASLVQLHAKWQAPYFKMYEGKFSSSREFIRDLITKEKLGDSMIDSLLQILSA